MRALAISILLVCVARAISGAEFWDVRIELRKEEASSLMTQPRKAIAARVQIDGRPAVAARVKLKGGGTFQPLSEKPSFTIEVAPAEAEQLPFSATKIHLNNSADDASYLKEKLGSEMFATAGIPTPRVGHARVSLDGRELGLYVLKEGFDEKFAIRAFGETAAIYDSDENGAQTVDLDVGEDRSDRLNSLWRATGVPISERSAKLGEVLDLDLFTKFIAMEVLICHWDGYALSENNFRICVLRDGRIQFLPSGMDQIFSNPNLSWRPNFAGKIARAFMETEEARGGYRATFETLLKEVLVTARWSNRVEQIFEELSPHLTVPEWRQIRAEAKELAERIAARKTNLEEHLKQGETDLLEFVDGVAIVTAWKAAVEQAGGSMSESAAALRIVAGPRTSAAWSATVRLPPGSYTVSTAVRTEGVVPLPFGTRHGASLRVLGRNAQSEAVVGSTNVVLRCAFEVAQPEEVVLLCELRASGGRAEFDRRVEVRANTKK